MDHHHALNQLRSYKFLLNALNYAIFDRINNDYFYDPFEIENANNKKDEIINEIIQELSNPDCYSPRPALAYFAPKNELCDRRMVYISIKDLTIRYGFVILFSEEIEHEIHPQCFANRRAQGQAAITRFVEEFATGGWARFCQWQSEQSSQYSVLLRTDISAFYDSISHDYLIDAVCRHLSLASECPLIQLFRKVIQIPVIYYCPISGEISGPANMYQGLPIGDSVEGYLANIYLKDVDNSMTNENATYGRYVDDIRLFGQTRQDVIRKLRILQEQLLRKGLNLNSSKTEIAENESELKQLISHLISDGDYHVIDEDSEMANDSIITSKIDQPFECFSRNFSETDKFTKAGDAKDFCKYLSARDELNRLLVPLGYRVQWHVERLQEAIIKWRGSGKHASWLLLQTAFDNQVPDDTKLLAVKVLLQLLQNTNVSEYNRYRLLHHLVKNRRKKDGTTYRFFNNLSSTHQQIIIDLMPSYISSPAFELNIIGLYTLYVSDLIEFSKLKIIINSYANPRCQPLRDAIRLIDKPVQVIGNYDVAMDYEPDEVPDLY